MILFSSCQDIFSPLNTSVTNTACLEGEKYGQRGKEYHIFSPNWILQFAITSQVRNRCWPGKKNIFFSPLLHICLPFLKVDQLWHGLRGKKFWLRGKKYHIFSPSWIFVLQLVVKMKNIGTKGKKYDIISPLAHIFSQVGQNFMDHCFCTVFFVTFSSFSLSFYFF